MQFRSIRFKTTLLYSGILLAILIVYNVVLFYTVHSILIKNIDNELQIKAKEISDILQTYEKIKNISSHPLSILEEMMHANGIYPSKAAIIDDLWRSEFETLKLNEDYINILNDRGKPLIHSSNVTEKIYALFLSKIGFSTHNRYFKSLRGNSLKLRFINLPFLYKQNLLLTIQVATPLNRVYAFLAKLMLISSVCIVIIVSVTSFLGSFFVVRILNPVVTVIKAANNISHMDLSTRISGNITDIEMRQLIDSFNSMIERLEKSFTHINEFNSYVAHELKTPLAIVKGELELGIEQFQEEGKDPKLLLDCLEEIDRMIKITKDLLLLTKLDYKPQILKFEEIDFKPFFDEIAEHSRILSSEKEIQMMADYPQERLMINCDKVHLRRLFLNIITNAIKYTPPYGSIHLSVKKDKNNLCFTVADNGEGISEGDLDKIFNKFFRVDKGEMSQETGFGLGLSIALSIAKAHQGDITVHSRLAEGTSFIITLPLSS